MIEKISFNAGRNWEIGEEICSCELLVSSSVLEFEDLSLNTQEAEFNLEFFRWGNFDLNEDWNDDVDSV